MVDRGTVKYFDRSDGKNFGFLWRLDHSGKPVEPEIFFHYNEGQFLSHDGEHPICAGTTGLFRGREIRLTPPIKGDELVFESTLGNRGEKASFWTYASMWDAMVEQLANRPLHRVIKQVRSQEVVTTETVWEGQNLEWLSVDYFRSDYIDRLSSGSSWEHIFEQRMPDGSWVQVKDPRPKLCCVDERVFRKYAPYTWRQPTCSARCPI